jgi:predicted DNA-binding protein
MVSNPLLFCYLQICYNLVYKEIIVTTTIRVSTETRDTLNQLAKRKGISLQNAVREAVETYRRQQLLEAANAAYAKLRANPKASKDFDDETKLWDVTLADGLNEK